MLDTLARGRDAGRSWSLDRAGLVALLERAGLTREQRLAWHVAAERADGALHQALLESLHLPYDEVAAIRRAAART